MAADQQINITANQFASLSVTLTWVAAGAPIDVTGYTARMHVRNPSVNKFPLCLELTTENGGVSVGGADGKVTLTATAAQTGAMTPGAHVYDLLMLSGADAHRMAEGTFTVVRGVTTLG